MRMSRLLAPLLGIAVVFLFGACAGEGPPPEGLLLPVGDADAGREAFIALRCYTCHAVAEDPDMPEPVSANKGPAVGNFAPEQTAEQIALSVISPSHWIAPPRDSTMSHMGDFREVMTVQQLLDVVTWLVEKHR